VRSRARLSFAAAACPAARARLLTGRISETKADGAILTAVKRHPVAAVLRKVATG
jgi:hypothetical protein